MNLSWLVFWGLIAWAVCGTLFFLLKSISGMKTMLLGLEVTLLGIALLVSPVFCGNSSLSLVGTCVAALGCLIFVIGLRKRD